MSSSPFRTLAENNDDGEFVVVENLGIDSCDEEGSFTPPQERKDIKLVDQPEPSASSSSFPSLPADPVRLQGPEKENKYLNSSPNNIHHNQTAADRTPERVSAHQSSSRNQRETEAVRRSPGKEERLPLVGRDNSTARKRAARAKAGARRKLRWLNVHQISQKHEEHDDDVLFMRDLLPSVRSPLCTLLEEPELLEAFHKFSVSSTHYSKEALEQQDASYLDRKARLEKMHLQASSRNYARITRDIRAMFKRTTLPLDRMQEYEEEIIDLFTSQPDAVLTKILDNSHERLIYHGVCQYYSLHSASETIDGRRVTSVVNKRKDTAFDCPVQLLSDFIREQKHH